ncbi:hypothetical protein DFH27DRAFT_569121 [Peziza echinospora]|nr:hypothetical protein DFH27DRAFT_569121 [Peziza echinospora]
MPAYIKTGRGGAGNMITPEELQRKEADVEAQQSEALSNELAKEPVEGPPGDGLEYKHMGRGGAGNWFTPAELKSTGTYTDTTVKCPNPTSLNPAPSSTHIDPRPWRGRGGAGNFAPDKPLEPEQMELEERKVAEVIEAEVRQSVDLGLAKPGLAYISPRDRDISKS